MSAAYEEVSAPNRVALAGSWAAGWSSVRRVARRSTTLIRQVIRFSAAGIVGTLAYIGLYMLFDLWMPLLLGNALAWLVTTLATNEAQRRWAFGVREGHTADVVIGLITSLATLIVTTFAVSILRQSDVSATVVALVAINTAAGTARFLTVRWWFVHRRHAVTRTAS